MTRMLLAAIASVALLASPARASPPARSKAVAVGAPCRGDGHNDHRSRAAIAAFKRAHPCPATGKRSGPCPGYVIDHWCALQCCGLDAPVNMRWQDDATAKLKDRWEGNCATCTVRNRKPHPK